MLRVFEQFILWIDDDRGSGGGGDVMHFEERFQH